jgi:hypothetical protein
MPSARADVRVEMLDPAAPTAIEPESALDDLGVGGACSGLDRSSPVDEAVDGAVVDGRLASWVTPAAAVAPIMAAMSNRRMTWRLMVL